MTDVREIIARVAWDAHRRGNPYALWADRILESLTSAGFRILGPDEIDGPTVEKCAEVAEDRAEWDPLKSGDMRTAIRALKENRT